MKLQFADIQWSFFKLVVFVVAASLVIILPFTDDIDPVAGLAWAGAVTGALLGAAGLVALELKRDQDKDDLARSAATAAVVEVGQIQADLVAAVSWRMKYRNQNIPPFALHVTRASFQRIRSNSLKQYALSIGALYPNAAKAILAFDHVVLSIANSENSLWTTIDSSAQSIQEQRDQYFLLLEESVERNMPLACKLLGDLNAVSSGEIGNLKSDWLAVKSQFSL